MQRSIKLACLVFLFIAASLRADNATTAPAPKPGTQTAESFEAKIGLKYLLYLPKDYGKDPAKQFPLVLFLHGSGERGSDVQKVAMHGPPKLAAAGKEFPFIIVSPQCPDKQWWDVQVLHALLEDVETKYSVDKDRIYLTGLSMGGFGTWEMASRYPDLFAAIVPICGGGDPQRVKRMVNLPIWVFHGEEDKAVPIQRSQDMVDALKAAGATDVQFTRYPKTGHDSWVKAYDDPKLYEWMLSKKRKGDTPATK